MHCSIGFKWSLHITVQFNIEFLVRRARYYYTNKKAWCYKVITWSYTKGMFKSNGGNEMKWNITLKVIMIFCNNAKIIRRELVVFWWYFETQMLLPWLVCFNIWVRLEWHNSVIYIHKCHWINGTESAVNRALDGYTYPG